MPGALIVFATPVAGVFQKLQPTLLQAKYSPKFGAAIFHFAANSIVCSALARSARSKQLTAAIASLELSLYVPFASRPV